MPKSVNVEATELNIMSEYYKLYITLQNLLRFVIIKTHEVYF